MDLRSSRGYQLTNRACIEITSCPDGFLLINKACVFKEECDTAMYLNEASEPSRSLRSSVRRFVADSIYSSSQQVRLLQGQVGIQLFSNAGVQMVRQYSTRYTDGPC